MFLTPLGVAIGQTSATQGPASKSSPPPTFQASGIQGNTAPSGYAAGASEAYSKKVATLLPELQAADLLRILPPTPEKGCAEEAELLRSVDAAPQEFAPNARLGRFYLRHANPSLAMRYLSVALQRRPDDREMLRYAAIAELQSKNYAGAAESIHRLLQIGGEDANARRLSGALDAELGHSSEAVQDFVVASRLDPSAANLYSAALAELAFGSVPAAEAAFDSAAKLHPESSELWLGLGVAALLAGHKSTAGDPLWKAASGTGTSLLALTLLAMRDGDDEALERRVTQQLELLAGQHSSDAARDAVVHYDYAVELGKAKATGPSPHTLEVRRQQLELAVKEQPDFAAAHFQLGVLEAERDNTSAAAAELAQATALDDDIPEWHYRLSRIYRRLNQPQAAELELHRFQELKAAHAGRDELLEGMPLRSLIAVPARCSVPAR